MAAYTLVIAVITIFLLVGAWPSASEDLTLNATSNIKETNVFNSIGNINSTRTVTIPLIGVHAFVGPETLVVVIMILAGILGACIFSLGAISDHVARHKDFEAVWKAWYYLRPVTGAGLALLFYFLLRGGVLTIGAEFTNINLIVVAGLAGLVGMFSEQALNKLKQLAETTFGPSTPSPTKPNKKDGSNNESGPE